MFNLEISTDHTSSAEGEDGAGEAEMNHSLSCSGVMAEGGAGGQ